MNIRKLSAAFLILLLMGNAAEAKIVRGKVHCGDKALSGVIVTDGSSFTKTSKSGKFRFDIRDDAMFVYIVTPSGYVSDYSSGSPKFYMEADGRNTFDFNLYETASAERYTLFSVSDPQMRNRKQLEQFSGAPLQDLICQGRKYSEQGPVTAIMLGDIGWDYTEIHAEYKKAVSEAGFPIYTIPGNHDYDKRVDFNDYLHDYFSNFGPCNYAFFLGKDIVIGVNNIIYKEEKKYVEGYSDEVLEFVRGLMEMIPEGTHVFVAQHSPVVKENSGAYIENAGKFLSVFDGYRVDILSGHTHYMANVQISDNVLDHNAASVCGSWWVADWCRDGTPRGYEIFNVSGDDIRWHYHPVDYDDDFQVEIIRPGQSMYHPNSIVANIWDCDPEWTVSWSEDGRDMGSMQQVKDVSPTYIRMIDEYYESIGKPIPDFRKPTRLPHYYVATPSQYAKTVTVNVKSRFGQEWHFDIDMTDYVDVQAHRGGAGLWPENTFTSMTGAMSLGVNTLEMDLHVSADGRVVVSHDAYFHSRYATRPDGSEVKPSEPKEYIFTMPYDSVARYDVGKRPSTVWPDKLQVAEMKPLASELLDYTEKYASDNGLSPFRYNIEIKSKTGKGEGVNWPEYHDFVDKCVELLLSKDLGDRLVVQCFDVRALNYMHEKYPQLKLSYLIDRKVVDLDAAMSELNFIPEWISPEYSLVNEDFVAKCHDLGMKIVPWTVDQPEDISKMIGLGVEAVISNYPDRLLDITRGYVK